MQITQDTLNRIVALAKKSDFGLGNGLTHKNGHLQMSIYGEQNLETLAMAIVNAYDEKYDLISIVAAALQIVAKDSGSNVKGEPTARQSKPQEDGS
jgi:hypothetical protein